MTNKLATSRTDPCTIGKSRSAIASIMSLPTPLIAKTCSVIIVPPSKNPKFIPITVMTGIIAFLIQWTNTTTFSLTPFALAVLTKSERITSSIEDLVIRAINAAEPVPSVIAGNASSFMP